MWTNVAAISRPQFLGQHGTPLGKCCALESTATDSGAASPLLERLSKLWEHILCDPTKSSLQLLGQSFRGPAFFE